MDIIYAYKTADGIVHLDDDSAIRHLDKLKTPHADALLTLFRHCDGKQKGFISLLDNPDFFAHVAAIDAIHKDMQIINTTRAWDE